MNDCLFLYFKRAFAANLLVIATDSLTNKQDQDLYI